MASNALEKYFYSFITCLALCLILTAVPAWAFGDYLGGPHMTDQELGQVRGGYSGFYFGVSFSGYWDNLGNVSGTLAYGGDVSDAQPTLPPPSGEVAQVSGAGVEVQAYVGNFQGASGIFQITQSPGSYNVVHNNLIVELTFINVADEAAVPALMNYLPWR